MQELIQTARAAGVTVMTLDRASRLNALTYEMAAQLLRALQEVAGDPDTRVVVLTGAGKAFSVGIDLTENLDQSVDGRGLVASRVALLQRLAGITTILREMPQPVVAAVHGPAVGAGFAMAIGCDLRVLDSTASFDTAFLRLGLGGAEMGVSWLLPRLVGSAVASEMMYGLRRVDAEDALRLGLASRVVGQGEDVTEALVLARSLAAQSPLALRMTKEVVTAGLVAPDLATAMGIESRTQVLCTMTDAFEEGVRAFGEKRTPVFEDR